MLKRARYGLKKFLPELSSFSNYMPEDAVNEVYYGLIKMISTNLLKYGKVSCPDLGDFILYARKPHMSLDVKSQKMVLLPEKKMIKFRPCRKIKAHFYKVK